MSTERILATGRVSATGRIASTGRISARDRREGATVISGVKGYYRADPETITLVDGNVASWADISGNGNHLSQSAISKRPVYSPVSSINNQPAVTFSVAKVLQGPLLQNAVNPWTMGAVFRSTSNTGTGHCMFAASNPGGHALTINAQASGNREVRANGVANCVDALATTNAEVWIATGVAAATLTTLSLFTGTSFTPRTLTPNTTATVSPTGSSLTFVGAINTTPVFPFVGDLAEIFFISRILTNAEITNYLSYVQSRYGVL